MIIIGDKVLKENTATYTVLIRLEIATVGLEVLDVQLFRA